MLPPDSDPLPEHARATAAFWDAQVGARPALKDDGLIFLNHYVGPTRDEWSDVQRIEANRACARLPESWRTLPVLAAREGVFVDPLFVWIVGRIKRADQP